MSIRITSRRPGMGETGQGHVGFRDFPFTRKQARPPQPGHRMRMPRRHDEGHVHGAWPVSTLAIWQGTYRGQNK
jgi:hypothetical protein